MKAFICVLLFVGVALAQTGGSAGEQKQGKLHEGISHDKPLRELGDLKFSPLKGRIRGSVASSTDTLMRAAMAHEPATVALFFSPETVVEAKSVLPASGIYKGMIGLLELAFNSGIAFQKENLSYDILAVDEARATSIVRVKFGGKFHRTGRSVESSSTVYFCWRFGKVAKVMIVENDPKKMRDAFETKAERIVGDFHESLFRCGACDDTVKLLADDVKSTVRMFPQSIGESLSYSGIEAFKKLQAEPSAKWVLNRISKVETLFADNSTVITKSSLGNGSPAMRAAILGKPAVDYRLLPGGSSADSDSLADLALISITKVNDAGKIVSCESELSAPLMPWHLRTLGLVGLPALKNVTKVEHGTAHVESPAKIKNLFMGEQA